MSDAPFDAARAMLRAPDLFPRFVVEEAGQAVVDVDLAPSDTLLIARRAHGVQAYTARQLAYHHLAQGTLAGEPYLVSF